MSNTLFTIFSTELKKQIGIWNEIKCRKLLSQIIRRSSFIQRKPDFIEEEDSPSDNVFTVEEELDGIGNLVDLVDFVAVTFFWGRL